VPADVLVIGYGNTLRGDDGIGAAVAEAIIAAALPGVGVIVAHQLTPELAADLAEARRVVFVDAAVGGEPVTETELVPEPAAASLTHAPDPRALLALTRAACGRSPEAWLVTVAGADFGYREGLTEVGRRHARLAAERVKCLLRR
jgi:hydrogenase maturation protease